MLFIIFQKIIKTSFPQNIAHKRIDILFPCFDYSALNQPLSPHFLSLWGKSNLNKPTHEREVKNTKTIVFNLRGGRVCMLHKQNKGLREIKLKQNTLECQNSGSGTHPGLGLDLGLLKISSGGVFTISSHVEGPNPAEHYPNPFPILVRHSWPLINLTWPKISINFIIFNIPYKQHFTRNCTRFKIPNDVI